MITGTSIKQSSIIKKMDYTKIGDIENMNYSKIINVTLI